MILRIGTFYKVAFPIIKKTLIENKEKVEILKSGKLINIDKANFTEYRPFQIYASTLDIFLEDTKLHCEHVEVINIIKSNIPLMLSKTLTDLNNITETRLFENRLFENRQLHSKTILQIDIILDGMLKVFTHINKYIRYLNEYYINSFLDKIDTDKMYKDILSVSNIYYAMLGKLPKDPIYQDLVFSEFTISATNMKIILKKYGNLYKLLMYEFMVDVELFV